MFARITPVKTKVFAKNSEQHLNAFAKKDFHAGTVVVIQVRFLLFKVLRCLFCEYQTYPSSARPSNSYVPNYNSSPEILN